MRQKYKQYLQLQGGEKRYRPQLGVACGVVQGYASPPPAACALACFAFLASTASEFSCTYTHAYTLKRSPESLPSHVLVRTYRPILSVLGCELSESKLRVIQGTHTRYFFLCFRVSKEIIGPPPSPLPPSPPHPRPRSREHPWGSPPLSCIVGGRNEGGRQH